MVFEVRCFKCGAHAAQIVLGGRRIIHARCHACDANLLAEVLEFERAVEQEMAIDDGDPPTIETLDEDTSVV